jgi:uncharacterized protein with PQ loop repeat
MYQAIKTSVLWFLGFGLFTWSLGIEFYHAVQAGLVGFLVSMILVIILMLTDEYAKDVFFDTDDTPLESQNWVHLLIGCIFDFIPIALIVAGTCIFLLRGLAILAG